MTRSTAAPSDGTSHKVAKAGTAKKTGPRKVKAKAIEPLPETAFGNQQMTLFQSFLPIAEGRDQSSNAIDFWDSAPRYSVSRQKQNELRQSVRGRDEVEESGGYLPTRKITFQYRQVPVTAIITPARIEECDKDGKPTGKEIEYYPSAREELIEHALRRLATEKDSGFYAESTPASRSGVFFTLYRLRQELADQGHSMTHRDLAEGLDILAKSGIRFLAEGAHDLEFEGMFSQANFLPHLIGVTRQDLEKNPNGKWYAEFHPLVTRSISKIQYRQFNYDRFMSGKTQLARWLISQLVLKYTQAAMTAPFMMKYSTIKRDSGLLSGYRLERQAVAALDDAWEEVKARGVLSSIKREEERGPRNKLEDVRYTVLPTSAFTKEQKAANRRLLDARVAGGLASPQQDQLL